MNTLRHLAGFALLVMTVSAGVSKPSFRANLKQFGYIGGQGPAEYSSLGFLSDDMLLVAINQGDFGGVEPPSILVLFEFSKKQASRRAVMPIVKSARSVALLTNGNFLVASATDVRLCSPDLRCEKSSPTKTGVPLDTHGLKLLNLADDVVLRVNDASADGTRTVSSELSTTTWYSILHPLNGIDEPTRNLRRITVYDGPSRSTLLSLHYNPKNHLVGPALSPNGKKLAIVHEAMLEVYDLP